ncbi:O-antigen ligase family protein [Tolypothrix sp. FACHB-123]|uniref:O-antigen ligase family protein n=1 Tax=Tolypothrix sp. FACHB-123 TaxID=2692868 RepID=UPI00168335B9|nr:O-antigen ligase family protein [Tolypothrix sp. FACHB-123]MBD2355853.1 O-antigen ligase family protein [Tolypothrix sp. FACHB-123]
MRRFIYRLSLLVIFLLPWEFAIDIPVLGKLNNFVELFAGACWLIAIVTSGRFRQLHAFHILFLIFIAWNAASVFWSVEPTKSFSFLFSYIQRLGLTLLIWDTYTTFTNLKNGLQAYVLGVYVAVIFTLFNFLTNNTGGNYQRFAVTGFQPDDSGFNMALGIPIAWYLASTTNNQDSHWWKLINYIFIPAALIGIILTGTRTALICTLPTILLILSSFKRLKVSTRIILIILFSGVVFSLQFFVPETLFLRLQSTGSEITSGDLNGRLIIWREGFASFLQHPFLGVGLGAIRTTNSLGKVAHNSFISVLVEVGGIGLLLFLAIFLLVCYLALRQPKVHSMFWLTLLIIWTIGASTLTWEWRKQTWLFFSLAVVSGTLFRDYYLSRTKSIFKRYVLNHENSIKQI